MSLPPGYVQTKQLASGFFATVTACTDSKGRKVALKRLKKSHGANEEYRRRFEREIQITSDLSDVDGVVRIRDQGEHEKLPYYTMPLASMNLFEYVRSRNALLEMHSRIDLCRQVISTMSLAHGRGTIHRDLSPQNVLVYLKEEQPHTRIADFGLGKSPEALHALTTSSQSNYGQALYVSPEQREQLAQATAASDVYSLGKLVSFVMTGRDPDNAQQHRLAPVTRKACQHSPADRYPTATEMLGAFEGVVKLVLGPADESVTEFADLEVAKAPLDWKSIHFLVTSAKYEGRAYFGYLEPVMAFFKDNVRLEEYAEAVGALIDEFANRFCEVVDAAATEVGWPFSAASGFYDLQARLFRVCHESEVKVRLFSSLWYNAVECDQWAAQGELSSLLRQQGLDDILQVELAAVIADRRGKYGLDEVLKAAPIGPIRNAIRTVKQAKAVE